MNVHEINEALTSHMAGPGWTVVGAIVCFAIAIALILLIRQIRHEFGERCPTLGTALFVLIGVMIMKGFERACGDVPTLLDMLRDGAILISVLFLLLKSWRSCRGQ